VVLEDLVLDILYQALWFIMQVAVVVAAETVVQELLLL
jgi:hypothetical protein